MKILIADDNIIKTKKLINYFVSSCRIEREEIETANCAFAARRHLLSENFDLMILDISLPFRDEDEPKWETSIELLTEISERDTLKKPGSIIGFTAYQELASQVSPQFQSKLWSIISYDDSSDAWQTPLMHCVDYIRGRENEKITRKYNYDLCIITALQSEMEKIHQLPWNWGAYLPIDDTSFYRTGHFKTGKRDYTVATAVAPRMGMVSSALLTAKLLTNLTPRFVVMPGICAGIPGKAKLGDILLADPSWDWQSGKRVNDSGNPAFAVSPHQLPVAEHIRSRGQLLKVDKSLWREVKDGYGGRAPDHELSLVIGPVASGSAVLADEEVVDEIKKQERNLIGVEMEIYGVYSACANSGFPKPTTFAMKSVCDFANADKNDDYQDYAAYTSAQAVRIFLEKYIDDLSVII